MDSLWTITPKGNMETKQMTLPPPPFPHFFHLNFGQTQPIRATHHTLLESRHPEVTKNPYYALFPEGSQKSISLWPIIEIMKMNTKEKVKLLVNFH